MSANFPIYNRGTRMDCSAASTRMQIAATPAEIAADDVLIINPSSREIFVRAGDASVTADNACMLIGPKTKEVFSKGGSTHLAALAVGGSATLIVIIGSGA